MRKGSEKSQYNIRIDARLLQRYKDFCKENGLDPQGQIVNFMKRIVDSEYLFQEKLWEVLTKDMK